MDAEWDDLAATMAILDRYREPTPTAPYTTR
jgi:hypothetical protein